MATRRGPRRPYHHGNLRDALLDAAERALSRDGTRELALRAVARGAGVSHAAAYHHFRDREALLRAVATRGFEQLGAALSGGEGRAGGSIDFLEMGVAYVRFAAEHPALFRLMFGPEAARGRARDSTLRAASERAFLVLVNGVRRVAPDADAATVQRRAVAAWSIVHGLSALLLDDQLADTGLSVGDPERVAREVLGGGPPGSRQ